MATKENRSMKLALGQLEDALTPAEASAMAALLLRIAGVLCAYAAAEQPGPELLAQLSDLLPDPAAAAVA